MSILQMDSVAKRLYLGFALIFALFGVYWTTITVLENNVRDLDTLLIRQTNVQLQAKDIYISMRGAYGQGMAFAANGDAYHAKTRDATFDEMEKQIEALKVQLRRPESQALLAELQEELNKFQRLIIKLGDIKMAGYLSSSTEMQTIFKEIVAQSRVYGATSTKLQNYFSSRTAEQLQQKENLREFAQWISIVIGGLVLILGLTTAAIIGRSIRLPVRDLSRVMEEIAAGNLDCVVTGTKRRDELGLMSRRLDAFRSQLAEAAMLRSEADLVDARNAERVKDERLKIADQFESRMGALSSAFTQAAEEMTNAATNLSATAAQTSLQAGAVANAAEEAAANVQTVAASTEEMSASIGEIGAQVQQASDVSQTASQEAARTETEVRALADAASKIGEVVDLINNIANQTNLLALNATIEAARAGEMGKGFAVVAQEVKQLAAQTSKATDEIGQKIGEIQQATRTTVGSIESIVGTIGQIRQISTTIASAIEEQSVATREIASNTQRAAQGTDQVTTNIAGVGTAARNTGAASARLMELSTGLSGRASELQRDVSSFVEQLRAG